MHARTCSHALAALLAGLAVLVTASVAHADSLTIYGDSNWERCSTLCPKAIQQASARCKRALGTTHVSNCGCDEGVQPPSSTVTYECKPLRGVLDADVVYHANDKILRGSNAPGKARIAWSLSHMLGDPLVTCQVLWMVPNPEALARALATTVDVIPEVRSARSRVPASAIDDESLGVDGKVRLVVRDSAGGRGLPSRQEKTVWCGLGVVGDTFYGTYPQYQQLSKERRSRYLNWMLPDVPDWDELVVTQDKAYQTTAMYELPGGQGVGREESLRIAREGLNPERATVFLEVDVAPVRSWLADQETAWRTEQYEKRVAERQRQREEEARQRAFERTMERMRAEREAAESGGADDVSEDEVDAAEVEEDAFWNTPQESRTVEDSEEDDEADEELERLREAVEAAESRASDLRDAADRSRRERKLPTSGWNGVRAVPAAESRIPSGSHLYAKFNDGVPEICVLAKAGDLEELELEPITGNDCPRLVCGCSDRSYDCVRGQCVKRGALRFTLEWSARSDFDLYVRTPDDTTISYSSKNYRGVQALDVDNTKGGSDAVENIYFDSPDAGRYRFWVVNFGGDDSGTARVTVHVGGREVDRESEYLSSSKEDRTSKWSFDYQSKPGQ